MGFLGDTVQSLIDAFNGGPSDWRGRLAGEIVLKSPEGTEFRARWIESSRETSKKLGILKHPKIRGDFAQDMKAASTLWSIPFFFEGLNNDVDAKAFNYACCNEDGNWDITHPVHGSLGLQLISVKQIDKPVESGNVTEFNTEWIEPIDPLTLKTAREMKGIIDAKVAALNVSGAQAFANKILDASNAMRGAIESTTEGIGRVTDLILGPMFTTVDALDNAENAIMNGIRDGYNATVLQVLSLAGQVQALIELPLQAESSGGRAGTYALAATAFLDLLPGGSRRTIRTTATDQEKINAMATVELALTATIAALGSITTTMAISPKGLGPDSVGTLATRADAVKMATDLAATFNTIVDAMELAQDDFSTKTIDKQYYSFLESYADAASLIYLSIEYLLQAAMNLAIERRFTLEYPRAPIEIAITEYGGLGVNDFNLDLFIYSNDLHGKDIMLLPRGREVVVYV
jgi:hypothetical protein